MAAMRQARGFTNNNSPGHGPSSHGCENGEVSNTTVVTKLLDLVPGPRSAPIIDDALDALGRMEEAKALRERYGSRVLMSLSPLSIFRLAAHFARQSQTTTPNFSGFSKAGWAALSGNRGQKRRLI